MNLTDKQKQWVPWAIVTILAFIVIALGFTCLGVYLGVTYFVPSPSDDEAVILGTTHFTNVEAEDITATDDLAVTDDASVGGAFAVTGASTLAVLTTSGNVTHSALTIFSSTTITVTDGQTITPTVYTGYRLNAAGAVTITLAACSNDFQTLLLYGEDAQTITINDTNVRTNDGGVQTIGQYDLITWACIDEDWVEVSESNNS